MSSSSASRKGNGNQSNNSGSSHKSSHIVAAMPSSTRGVSLSLPLLEGLCQRPESARSIVRDALTTLQAAQRIAKFVTTHYNNHKKMKQSSDNNKNEKRVTTCLKMIPYQQQLPPQQHWLWDAMRSSSRAERHVSARILLQGTFCEKGDEAAGGEGGEGEAAGAEGRGDDDDVVSEMAQFQLQHVLMALWNRHIIFPAGNSTAVALPSNIPMEWMALLKHVILGKMVTEERIMAFCFGGIPWICQSVWKLVTSLSMSSSSSSSGSGTGVSDEQQESCAPTQLQALIGLVELCYSLLLVVFIEPETTTTTTTTKTNASETGGGTTTAAGSGTATTNVNASSGSGSATATTTTSGSNSASTSTTTTTSTRRPPSRRLGPGSPRILIAGPANRPPGIPAGTTYSSWKENNNKNKESESSSSGDNNMADSAAVAKRLTMRRRVLKRLFWESMDSNTAAMAHPHHATTNNANNNNSNVGNNANSSNNTMMNPQLSPLACLVGAFHIWKTNTDWPYPGATADACITMLRQLVDPSSTAKAVSLAGLTGTSTTTTATAATTSGASASSSNTRTRDALNSAAAATTGRHKRRKRPRSSGSSSSASSTTSSGGSYLFRAENRRNASTGSNNTSTSSSSLAEQRRSGGGGGVGAASRSSSSTAAEAVDAAAADGTVTRLLSSVLGATASAAVRHSQSDPEDEEEVVVEEEDDDDDSEVEEEVVVHDHDEEENDNDHDVHESGHDVAAEHDEEIDSDDGGNNEEEDENEEEGEENEEEGNDDEDDDDEEDDDDDEEDDADEEELGQEDEGLVLHDDDVARFEGLLELNDAAGAMEIDLEDIEEASGANGLVMAATSAARSRLRAAAGAASASSSSGAATSSSGGASSKAAVDSRELSERKRMYLQACMQVLGVQHPPVMSASAALSLISRGGSVASSRAASRTASRCTSPVSHSRSHRGSLMSPSRGGASSSSEKTVAPPKCFSLAAEHSLLESAMGIVRPPKKPVNTKMIMRRAPTQEEFFRGSLSRNPISLSMLKPSGGGNSGSGPSSSGELYEPTVRDLRQHIADDLQMSDSAELLELLVANKILDVNLKLRVVHQVLWKNHLMEHSHSGPASSASSSSALASLLAGSGAGGPSFFSAGSGLSMMFSSGIGGISVGGSRGGVLSRSSGGQAITADTPLAALPPLVVTYRLAGVDGEATEDTVSTLVDPEAPSDAMSPEELEQLMEKEYGITRIVTEGRGVYVLLRSIEFHIQEVLRRIRRDDVSVLMEYGKNKKSSAVGKNKSRSKFKQSPPFPGLALLRCCAKLPSNRKKLLQARAPTILLRLLLDVLNALEDPQAKSSLALETSDTGDSGSNETADVLQELIEALASDINTTAVDAVTKSKETGPNAMDESQTDETASTTDSVAAATEGQDQDATTLSLVLSSLETISLSPPLRNIIAKLLPFLTYGQVDLSRELALNFARHIDVSALVDDDNDELPEGVTNMDISNEQSKENEGAVEAEAPSRKETNKSSVLMDAFVQASMTLPPNEVCNSLRSELINCGFIHRLASFISKDVPSSPPPWAAALLPKEDATNKGPPNKKRQAIINSWREFFQRQGIKMAFKMLIGLCKRHPQTQAYISQIGEEGDKLSTSGVSFLRACHWMESTSDNASNRVYVRGVGLLAETLMDELMDENDFVAKKVKALRRATRERKKEIAQARRSKALLNMSSFGPLAGGGALDANRKSEETAEDASARTQSAAGASLTASLFGPVLGLFQNSSGSTEAAHAEAAAASNTSRTSPRTSRKRSAAAAEIKAKEPPAKKPAWMTEMENLEDEEGLVCSVCQEGRTVQPSELLGLYAYVKKVSIPVDQCGARDTIDGTTLLRTLPSTLPESLVGTHAAEQWYVAGKAAGDDLRDSQRSTFSLSSSVSSSRRNTYYTTTVSAGNAIHFSCHQRARQADRNHPKAPKSEWEGAALRNSRVNCNVILPLVSSRSSDVPLVAVDSALTEYSTAVNNLTGTSSKFSMLWTVLHDVRFLLLRMAHGEPLNADCGGGSLSSNAQLLVHQLMMADMFEKDAQVDSPETSQHVRNLSAGFLAASAIVHAADYKGSSSTLSVLTRGIADSAPMAGLTCILTHNIRHDSRAGCESTDGKPHPRRRWVAGREFFLRGLVICAGRRHALGLETSGCISGRGGSTSSSGARGRSSTFPEWDSTETEEENAGTGGKKRSKPDIDDFGSALRPMITLYAILDQLSEAFVLNMKDPEIEESANRIVSVLEQCHKAKDIRELMECCNAPNYGEILDDFQKGMMSA